MRRPDHWSEAYLGLPWEVDYNCADLAIQVQREVFQKTVRVAGAHSPDFRALDAAIADNLAACDKTDDPQDGDGVLILCGSLRHVGIYCAMAEPWVLHNVHKAGVVRHRLRDLPRFGFQIEGYYRWL